MYRCAVDALSIKLVFVVLLYLSVPLFRFVFRLASVPCYVCVFVLGVFFSGGVLFALVFFSGRACVYFLCSGSSKATPRMIS